MKINQSIFRAYDLRGKYPEDLNEDIAYAVGRAVVRFLGAKEIAIGQDTRLSSPSLMKALIEGVTDEGAQVWDFGQTGVEMAYFVCGYYKLDGGIMVTASHNAKEFNGFKLIREKAISLTTGTGLEEVKKIVEEEAWEKEKGAKKKGTIKKIDPWEDYLSYIKKIIDPSTLRPFKVAFDAENGVGGVMIEKILGDSKIKLSKLNFMPDGNFPKHSPNPLIPENRKELIEEIKKLKEIEVGFITDGDADRVGVFDEKGEIVTTDFVGALIIEKMIKEGKDKFVWDLRRGWAIKDTAKKHGAKLCQTRAGYPFIKLKMREIGAAFGGETSGHYFYRSFFTSDSGMLTILYILSVLSEIKKPLSQIVQKMRDSYFMITEVNFEIKDAESLYKRIEDCYKKLGAKIGHVDGITVDFSDWHFNLRRSNNPEGLYRLNLETRKKELLEQKTQEVKQIIKEFGKEV